MEWIRVRARITPNGLAFADPLGKPVCRENNILWPAKKYPNGSAPLSETQWDITVTNNHVGKMVDQVRPVGMPEVAVSHGGRPQHQDPIAGSDADPTRVMPNNVTSTFAVEQFRQAESLAPSAAAAAPGNQRQPRNTLSVQALSDGCIPDDALRGKRLVIIGDVRGCHDTLHELLSKLSYDQSADCVIFLGGFVDADRPDDSVKTVWIANDLGAYLIAGEPEKRFLETFEANPQSATRKGSSASATQGLSDVCALLQSLPDSIRVPPFALDVSHDGTQLASQPSDSDNNAAWIDTYSAPMTAVVGRHDHFGLVWTDAILAIDTGCGRGGSLTAVVFSQEQPGGSVVSVQAAALPTAPTNWEGATEGTLTEWTRDVLADPPLIASIKIRDSERSVELGIGCNPLLAGTPRGTPVEFKYEGSFGFARVKPGYTPPAPALTLEAIERGKRFAMVRGWCGGALRLQVVGEGADGHGSLATDAFAYAADNDAALLESLPPGAFVCATLVEDTCTQDGSALRAIGVGRVFARPKGLGGTNDGLRDQTAPSEGSGQRFTGSITAISGGSATIVVDDRPDDTPATAPSSELLEVAPADLTTGLRVDFELVSTSNQNDKWMAKNVRPMSFVGALSRNGMGPEGITVWTIRSDSFEHELMAFPNANPEMMELQRDTPIRFEVCQSPTMVAEVDPNRPGTGSFPMVIHGRPLRVSGVVDSLKRDKMGESYGFVRSLQPDAYPNERIFVHESESSVLQRITVGASVDFTIVSNPLKRGQLKASDLTFSRTRTTLVRCPLLKPKDVLKVGVSKCGPTGALADPLYQLLQGPVGAGSAVEITLNVSDRPLVTASGERRDIRWSVVIADVGNDKRSASFYVPMGNPNYPPEASRGGFILHLPDPALVLVRCVAMHPKKLDGSTIGRSLASTQRRRERHTEMPNYPGITNDANGGRVLGTVTDVSFDEEGSLCAKVMVILRNESIAAFLTMYGLANTANPSTVFVEGAQVWCRLAGDGSNYGQILAVDTMLAPSNPGQPTKNFARADAMDFADACERLIRGSDGSNSSSGSGGGGNSPPTRPSDHSTSWTVLPGNGKGPEATKQRSMLDFRTATNTVESPVHIGDGFGVELMDGPSPFKLSGKDANHNQWEGFGAAPTAAASSSEVLPNTWSNTTNTTPW